MEETRETISSVINQAMEAKGMSIEKLSEETGIPERFIELLLSEKFSDLPSAPYTHGYIVKISDVLDLDGEEIWKTYLKNSGQIRQSGKFDKLPENRFSSSKINNKILILILVFIIVVGYFGLRAVLSSNIESELNLQNLEESSIVVNESEFQVEGSLAPRYQLTINQTPVYPDNNGDFQQTIQLEEGLNTVTFNITGVLGKEGEVVRQVLYRPENQSTSSNPTPGNQNFNN